MIHILSGYPRESAHRHDTVAEARICQQTDDYYAAEAMAEAQAENAWLVAAETNEIQRMETDLDAQMEWWMQPAT